MSSQRSEKQVQAFCAGAKGRLDVCQNGIELNAGMIQEPTQRSLEPNSTNFKLTLFYVCLHMTLLSLHIFAHLYMFSHVAIYMVVDQNSFIPERPFFANKKFTFAKLSRTPCLSFAGPMLANNTSYEDSFTTCQITPENHGSLLGSLLNMQLASRSPFSGQTFFAKFTEYTGPPPSTCTLTFARSFA